MEKAYLRYNGCRECLISKSSICSISFNDKERIRIDGADAFALLERRDEEDVVALANGVEAPLLLEIWLVEAPEAALEGEGAVRCALEDEASEVSESAFCGLLLIFVLDGTLLEDAEEEEVEPGAGSEGGEVTKGPKTSSCFESPILRL